MRMDKATMMALLSQMAENMSSGDVEGVEAVYDAEEDCFSRAKDYALLQPGDLVRLHMQGKSPKKGVFIKWVHGIPEMPAHVTVMCWNEDDKTMNPVTCPVWFLEVLA